MTVTMDAGSSSTIAMRWTGSCASGIERALG
jgi:hypothetical protein